MSSRKFKFVSPGIFLNEIDNSQLPRISDAVGPLVIGNTQMGPALKPVRVESFSEFVEIFGPPQPGGSGDDVWRDRSKITPTYASYAAQAYLRNSSPVNVIRLLGVQDANPTDGGVAGWKATNGNRPGAFGLFVGASGSAATEGGADDADSILDLYLAAVIYAAPSGSKEVEPRLYGHLGSSGLDAAAADYYITGALGAVVKANTRSTYPSWTMYMTEVTHQEATGGESVDRVTFNFDRSSSRYIRKVFNTSPTVTNEAITRTLATENYWLGETYENYINNNVLTDSTKVPVAVIIPLAEEKLDHAIHNEELQSSETGWFISQDLGEALTFDARNEKRSRKLFKMISINDGEFNQKNFKISIDNITAPQKDGIDPYGTFDVVLRRVEDNDGNERVVEKFSNCNLNPNSPAYIARKVGDMYMTWDSSDKRYRSYGNFANRSKYIRALMDSDVDGGFVEPALLPFGAYMPPVLKDISLHRTNSEVTAATATFTFSGIGTVNSEIELIDAAGLQRTYQFKGGVVSGTQDGADGDGGADSRILVNQGASATASAAELKIAIEHANGHNGTIVVGANSAPGVVLLTMSTTGDPGNTTITLDQTSGADFTATTNPNPPAKFAGGFPAPGVTVEGTWKVLQSDNDSDPLYWMGNTGPDIGKDADTEVEHIVSGSLPDIVRFKMPQLRMRVSSSHGDLNTPYDAFFGLQTSRSATTSRFDGSYVDFVRRFPSNASAENFQTAEGTGAFTKYSTVFTLDDLVVTGSNDDDATYVSGSRQRSADTGLGKSRTALNGWRDLLNTGFNKFTVPIWGGFDGIEITEADPFNNSRALKHPADSRSSYAYASVKRALDAASDPEVIECNMMAMPGIAVPSLTTALVRVCESRADALAIIDLPDVFKPAGETDADTFSDRVTGRVTTVVDALNERGINSSYGCAYYPWVKLYDEINEAQVWAPPSIIAMGVFANTEKRSAVWFAPAGFNRGGLTEGSAGIKVLGVTERVSSKDRDKLYAANINPIATFPAEGIVVFGQKTLQITASALDRINVRRLLIFVKKQVSRIAARLLFDQNVQTTWDRFVGQVDPFLVSVKMGFGLSDFKVILDQSTTTPDLIDRNIMYAKIFLKPARSIEYIAIDFVITNTGAAFED